MMKIKNIRMKKILLFSLLVILITGGLLNLKPKNKLKTLEKVNIAVYKGEYSILIYLAKYLGYFEEEGLDVIFTETDSGKAAVDLMIENKVDIGTASDTVFMFYSFKNNDIRILSSIHQGYNTGLIIRNEIDINNLRGKKMGVTQNTSGEFALLDFLVNNGLDLTDIEIVYLNPKEIIDSFITKKIDVAFSWEPNLYNIKKIEGDNVKIIKEDTINFKFLLLSNENWLKENNGKAEKFLRALIRAEEYQSLNEELVKQYIIKTFKYDKEYVNTIWNYSYPIIELPQILLNILEDQASWYLKYTNNKELILPNYLNYIDTRPLKKIKPTSVSIISDEK